MFGRSAICILQLVFRNNILFVAFSVLGVGVWKATEQIEVQDALEGLAVGGLADEHPGLGARVVATSIFDFLIDRLKVQQREAGVRHDLIDAVFALGGEDDLVRLLARVKADRKSTRLNSSH